MAKVLRSCDVVVRPQSRVPEVIRRVETGATLLLLDGVDGRVVARKGFIAVDQDGDVAYVPADCVERQAGFS